MTGALPLRGDGSMRPAGLVLPPARMPLLHDGRPLKRWRYVGIYGSELMLCAAAVRIMGIPQAFWAVLDRATGELHGHTAFTPGLVAVGDGHLAVRGRGVAIDLALTPAGEPMEITSPHGGSYIWTRKDPVNAHGTVTIGARRWELEAAGLIDASAGYHARATTWRWAAGVGMSAEGRRLAWNLVDGVHDLAAASERTVWVGGLAHEVGPVGFPGDLDGVTFSENGAALRFRAEAERAQSDDLKVFRSDYRQPFGTFSGTLPGGIELATGFGVMEWHDVRW